MEVILIKDVEKVGDRNEIVKVKAGFGRNYLIPQKLAIVANDSNRRTLAAWLRSIDKKQNAMLGTYQEMAAKVAGKTLTMVTKAGPSGRIFGSIGAVQIAAELNAKFGLNVDRKKVILAEDIKDLGEHTVTLNLHKEVMPTFTVSVISEEAPVAVATEAVAAAE
jgi:large subunit ribosomal protein L9